MRWMRATTDRGVGPSPVRMVPPSRTDRLHSWKEIAAYLKHGVRTVQRWEETEGLPVHRHPHEKRDSVYAYPLELDAWWTKHQAEFAGSEAAGAARPREIAIIGEPARWSRRWAIAAAALLLLLIAVGIWMRWGIPRLGSPALPFAKSDWVLIADFDNQTGDPIFDRSLETAFSVGLEQSRHANVLPRTRINDALQRMGKSSETRIDDQVGREICVREHVKGLITCGIAKAGREYALSARLVDPRTGGAVRSYLVRARDQDQIIEALGNLTGRIRGDLGESLASIRQSDDPLPLVTTSSLEALKLFSEGNYLWRKGQYREAVKAWESALMHDPDFAMAHGALGSAYMSHIFNENTKGKEHYQKALRRVERITDRERLYMRASFQQSLGHVDEAVRDYRLYLDTYPDDVSARFDLGVLLMASHRPEEAVEQFHQVLRVDPTHVRAWVDLATSDGDLDRPAEALANYAKAFELEPTWITLGNLNKEYGFLWVRSGNPAKAREVFELALAKPDMKSNALRSLALLDMYGGRYREAQKRLQQAILMNRDEEQPLSEARNGIFLAILLDGEGDRAGCIRALDRASEALARLSDPLLWLGARIGGLYASAGAAGKADRILRALTPRLDRENVADAADFHILEGEVAMAGGDYSRAIERFQLGAQAAPLPLALAGLARAYQKAADRGQAIASYEKLIRLGYRALGWEPQQSWIQAHAELAEMYLSQGERDKAAQKLDELERLWKDADPALPLAARIAELQRRIRGKNRIAAR